MSGSITWPINIIGNIIKFYEFYWTGGSHCLMGQQQTTTNSKYQLAWTFRHRHSNWQKQKIGDLGHARHSLNWKIYVWRNLRIRQPLPTCINTEKCSPFSLAVIGKLFSVVLEVAYLQKRVDNIRYRLPVSCCFLVSGVITEQLLLYPVVLPHPFHRQPRVAQRHRPEGIFRHCVLTSGLWGFCFVRQGRWK